MLSLLTWLLEKDKPVWVPGHCNSLVAGDFTSPYVEMGIRGRGRVAQVSGGWCKLLYPAGFAPFPALELNLSSLDERVYVSLFLSEPFPEDPPLSESS